MGFVLEASDTIVEHVESEEMVLELVKFRDYDIVILGLMRPDIEDFEMLRRMRVAQIVTPVLILSGISNPEAKFRGLDFGNDDYITKPYHKEELVARVQAVVRRSKRFQ